MTGFLTFSAIVISAIFTIDCSRTILALRKQHAALKTRSRRPGGFEV